MEMQHNFPFYDKEDLSLNTQIFHCAVLMRFFKLHFEMLNSESKESV